MLFAHLVTQVEVSPSKRALFHFPTPFHSPTPRLSPAPARTKLCRSGSHQTLIAGYGGGEGARGEDRGRGGLWSLIKIAENSVNYKQSSLEGGCETMVGLRWQNPRAAVQWCQPVGFGVGRDSFPFCNSSISPLHPPPHASLHPQVCCPLDKTALKIGLCPWCSGEENVVAEWPGVWAEKLLHLVACCGRGDGGGLQIPLRLGSRLSSLTSLFFSLPWRDLLKNGKSSLKWVFPCKLRFLMGTPCFVTASPVSGSATDTPSKMGWPSPPPALSSLAARGHPRQPKGLYLWDRFAPPTFAPISLKERGSCCCSKPTQPPRAPLLQHQRGCIRVSSGCTRQTSSEDVFSCSGRGVLARI